MSFFVDVQNNIFTPGQILVDHPDLFHCLTGQRDVELTGRLKNTVLTLQRPRGCQRVDVGKVNQISEPVKLPAHAVILLHVIHVG